MKVIIAGSRDYEIKDTSRIQEIVDDSGFHVTELVCGGASGVDTWAFTWAKVRDIPIKEFMADWKTLGKAAGPIRNGQMADYADALIAIKTKPDSRGTDDMIRRAQKRGIPVKIYTTY